MARLTNPNPRLLLTVVGAMALAAGVLALVLATHKPAQAAFPGADGKKIVFVSDRETAGEYTPEIFKMNPGGSGVQRLTVNTPSDYIYPRDTDPAWSPDRTKIAFARKNYDATAGYPGDFQIYVMDADGSNVTPLPDSYGDESSPTWSPDGSRIAYKKEVYIRDNDAGYPIFEYKIYVMDADGSDDAPLTDTPVTEGTGGEGSPDWSPGGKKIAFTRYKSQGPNAGTNIYTVKADGTGLKRLTKFMIGNWPHELDWSPDGSKILFAKYSATEQQTDVWVMDADGGEKKNLTRSPSSESSPAWSPGGEQIVFASSQGGDYGIWKMGADGSAKTPLTSNHFQDYSPDW